MDAYAALLDDLVAEERSLDDLVEVLDHEGWARPTPAEGWDVCDQIAHLAATEEWAQLAIGDPDGFRRQRDDYLGDTDRRDDELRSGHLGRRPPGGTDDPGWALAWWRTGRAAVLDGLRALDARARVPWFGPDMSAMSFATARLMETWAHGQDVADALGVVREPSARLRHIADLGIRTRGFAYASRSREVPDVPVRVDLAAPDDDIWSWGPAEAASSVLGPALDFCLVVTQRVHPADTELTITGDAAEEWMGIAQAFAGPPTGPRPPRARGG
ncbi:MAG: TIGR03084 family metal-binding protein [Acidimicrobiia bacterium]